MWSRWDKGQEGDRRLGRRGAVRAPNSFSMTAMRRPCCSCRIQFTSVVLPAPRKPVTQVTGTRGMVAMEAGVGDGDRRRFDERVRRFMVRRRKAGGSAQCLACAGRFGSAGDGGWTGAFVKGTRGRPWDAIVRAVALSVEPHPHANPRSKLLLLNALFAAVVLTYGWTGGREGNCTLTSGSGAAAPTVSSSSLLRRFCGGAARPETKCII